MQRVATFLLGPLLTLWLGSLWVIGYLVVPLLFARLPDRMLAGALAGELLALASWIGLIMVGPLAWCLRRTLPAGKRSAWVWWALLGVALGHLLQLAWIQPEMAAMKAGVAPLDVMQTSLRDRFVRWHAGASVLYLLQSLSGLVIAALAMGRFR